MVYVTSEPTKQRIFGKRVKSVLIATNIQGMHTPMSTQKLLDRPMQVVGLSLPISIVTKSQQRFS